MTCISKVLSYMRANDSSKGNQNKSIQINFKFRKTYQFSFLNTSGKRFDDHHSSFLLNSKSLICIKG